MNKKAMVKCPQCKKKFDYYSSEFRPFCCERCKEIDLGMWLTENYAIGSKEPLEDKDIDKIEEHYRQKGSSDE